MSHAPLKPPDTPHPKPSTSAGGRNIPFPKRRRAEWVSTAGPWRRGLTRLALVTSWGTVLLLTAGAILRVTWHDRAMPLVWFNSFTLYVYLPAYVAVCTGLVLRRWVLCTMSLLVIGCHLVWIAPDYVPARSAGNVAAGETPARPIRVFYQNVWMRTADYGKTVREIETVDPDIIVLVEYTRKWHERAVQAGGLRKYAYRTTDGDRFTGPVVVYSKLPLLSYRRRWPANRLVLDAVVDTPGGPLRIVAVHSPRPSYRHRAAYETFWQRVDAYLKEDSQPTLLVGDFNSTQHSRWYRHFTSGGLRDAFRDHRQGHLTTWPNGKTTIPPIRIDHVMLSDQVNCSAIRTGTSQGSDHKSVIFDLSVDRDASSS